MYGITVFLLVIIQMSDFIHLNSSQLTFQPKNYWTMQTALTAGRGGFRDNNMGSRREKDMTLDQFVDKTIGMLALISLGMKGQKNPEIDPFRSSSPGTSDDRRVDRGRILY